MASLRCTFASAILIDTYSSAKYFDRIAYKFLLFPRRYDHGDVDFSLSAVRP